MATILKLERIEREAGLVLLHTLHLSGQEVAMAEDCTFGGARLSVRPEHINLLVSAALDSRSRTFALANAHDADGFIEGKTYEFQGSPPKSMEKSKTVHPKPEKSKQPEVYFYKVGDQEKGPYTLQQLRSGTMDIVISPKGIDLSIDTGPNKALH
jgi:hypothetical protein